MRSVIVAPGAAAISFETLVAHLKGDLTDEQAYVEGVLVPAVQGMFSRLTRCFATSTTVEHRQHGWPDLANCIDLQWGPVSGVLSVSYTDAAGQPQTLPSDQWRLRHRDGQSSSVVLLSNPVVQDGSEVVVRYTAGFVAVPAEVELWMLGHIAHAWANRGDGGGIPAEPLPNLDVFIAAWRRAAI